MWGLWDPPAMLWDPTSGSAPQLAMTVGLLAVVVYLYTVVAFNFFRKFYNKSEDEDEPDMKCDDMMTVGGGGGSWGALGSLGGGRLGLSWGTSVGFLGGGWVVLGALGGLWVLSGAVLGILGTSGGFWGG